MTRLPARRSIRLKGFDYASNGGYVVTVCTHERRPLFGSIVEGHLQPSPVGSIVEREWWKTATMRAGVLLDEFILMPNHLHGIIILNFPEDAAGEPNAGSPIPAARPFLVPSRGLGAIVSGFKSAVTSAVKREHQRVVLPIWQRGYYDRIIRDDEELARFREYIANNPQQWEFDRYFEGKAEEGVSADSG